VRGMVGRGTEWCGNRGLSSTRNIFFISTNSVDDMPAFLFGRTAIEVCMVRFSFLSFFFLYLYPKRNAT